MKKLIAGILTASLALSLAACGSNDKSASDDSKKMQKKQNW
jgi:hypothetical protein